MIENIMEQSKTHNKSDDESIREINSILNKNQA